MPETNLPIYPGVELQSSVSIPTTKASNVPNLKQPASMVDSFLATYKDPYAMADATFNQAASPLVPTLRYSSDSLGYDYRDINLEYKYGDKYPALSFFNNLGKFGASFLGSFAQGMATIPFAMKAIKEGDTDVFFNNEMTNAFSEWQESLETSMPSFKTEYQDNHPFLSAIQPWNLKAFSGVWGDVIKNIGFTAGSISSALVQDALIGAVTGGIGATPLVGMQLAKLGRWASTLGKGVKGFTEAGANIRLARNAVNISSGLTTFGSRLNYGYKLLSSSLAEGSIEANQTYNSLKETLRQDFIDKYGFEPTGEYLKDIEKYSLDGGNANLIANTALLTLTNAITFDGVLRGRHLTRIANEKQIAQGTAIERKTLDTFALKTKADPFKSFADKFGFYGYKVGQKLAVPLNEAFEEGAQYFSDKTIEDYIRRRYDDVNYFYTDKLSESLHKGLTETLFTPEGQYNMILGFLSGGLINAVNTNIGKLTGARPTRAQVSTQTNAIVNLLNKNTLTGVFRNTYNETATSIGILRDMKKASEEGDVFKFKNLQRENFFNFVSSGVKTNRFDLRIEQLKDLKNLNKDQFEELTGGEFTEETKEVFDNYVDNLISEAESIKKSVTKVNNVFVNRYSSKTEPKEFQIYEDYKDALSYSLSLVDDSIVRHRKLGDEITQTLPGLDLNKAVNLVNYKGIRQTVNEFNQKLQDLKESKKGIDENSELANSINKEISFLESKVPVLQQTLTYLESRTKMQDSPNENFLLRPEQIDQYTRHVADILEYYSDEKIPDFIIKKQLLKKLEDVFKLDIQGRTATKYYNTLASRKGYNRFRNQINNLLAPYSTRIVIDDDGKFTYKTDEEILAEKEALVKALTTMRESIAKAQNTALPEEPVTEEEKQVINNIVNKEATGQDLTEEEKEIKAAKPNVYTNKKTAREKAEKAVDESLADLNIVDPESDLKSYEEEDTDESTSQEKSLKTKNVPVSDTRFEGANPYSLLGKIFGEDFEFNSGDGIALQNVFNIIFKTPYEKAVKDLSNNIRFVVNKSSSGLNPNSYTPIFHRDSQGKTTKVKAYENLLRKGYNVEIQVYAGDKFLGILTLGNSLYYKDSKGEIKPISEVTKDEYERATIQNNARGNKEASNHISTYEEFVQIASAFKTIADTIENAFENSDKTQYDFSEIGEMFEKINLWQGVSDRQREASEEGNTLVKDLEYFPENAVILEVPYSDDKRDNITKYRFISKSGVLTDIPENLYSFVSDNLKTIQDIDQRFVLITPTPNGQYYSNFSIVALRHSSLTEADINEAFKSLRNDSKSRANNYFDNLYINVTSGSSNEKGISVKIKKHRDYTATVYINDKNTRTRVTVGFTEKELKALKTMEDFVEAVNDKTDIFEKYETYLLLSDIKAKNINSEQASDFNYLTENLIAPVPASFAKDFYINFVPRKSFTGFQQAPQQPKAPVTPQAPIQPTSDIEAKKADIEKRRQETLKSVSGSASQMVVYVPNGENRSLTKEEESDVESIIQQLIEKGKTADQIIKYLSRQGFVRAVSVSTVDQISYIQGRINGTITTPVNSYSIIKDINAKYDAELAALDQQSTTSILTIEQQVLQNAINSGVLKGANLVTAQFAVQNQENTVEFFSNVADQALNKIAPGATSAEESMKRAIETYGQELVDFATTMFPAEKPKSDAKLSVSEYQDSLYSLGYEKKDIDNMQVSDAKDIVDKKIRKKVEGNFGILENIRILADKLNNAQTEEEKLEIGMEIFELQQQLLSTDEGRLASIIEKDFETIISQLEDNNQIEKDCK